MPHCRTIEFLRRRYAAAILRDDADTAGRLRAELDAIMNGRAPAPGEAAARQVPCEPPPAALEPRLQLVTPVTGLLEWSVRRPVVASPRDPAGKATPDHPVCPPAHAPLPQLASLEVEGRAWS